MRMITAGNTFLVVYEFILADTYFHFVWAGAGAVFTSFIRVSRDTSFLSSFYDIGLGFLFDK